MPWMVDVNRKVQKQYPTLPKGVKESLFTLLFEMEVAATGQIMANLEKAVTTAISRKVILPMWLSGKKCREERTI